MAHTTEEVARLDQQARVVGQHAQRLSEDVERFEHSYAQLREERDRLAQQVLDLEYQRARLSRQLTIMEELPRAVREAIAARQPPRLSWFAAPESVAKPNRGLVVQDGRSTIGGRHTVAIRVHTPEPLR